jgi:endonuclease/exonuclease/phosphatase (EEP) superfamily protein YafD
LKPSEKAGPTWSFAALAAVLAALAAVYLTVGDLTTWSECLTVWPPLVWGVIVSPHLVVLALRRRHRELAAGVGLVVLFLAVTMEWPRLPRPSTEAPAATRLRVVSWNVAGTMPLAALQAWAPDLCLLQEIGTPRSIELRGYWEGWQWKGAVDPGTLSRWPVTRLPTRRVGPWTEPQVLRLDRPDGPALVVVNVRLVLPAFVVAAAAFERPTFAGLADAHRLRLRQFTELATLLRETLAREGTRTALLCGDFNTPGGSRSLEPLRAVVEDVWPRAGQGWGATMTEWMPVSRIDQCWATPDLQPLVARVVRGPSDHRALIVDLRWPASAVPATR